ncbi:MAG TPA: hypothetical protein VLR54_07030, partial [Methanobacteriaceae archaeon]|nr:hypothetical protein [Methanobacteriaceae archaeon]
MGAYSNQESFKKIVILFLTLMTIFALFSMIFQGNADYSTLITDVSVVFFNIIAAASLSYVADWSSRNDRKRYPAWLFLAIAQSAFTFADIIYLVLDIVFKVTPYPSIADLFFLSYYPLFAIGLF